MDKPKLYVLVGLSGSGKSTLAAQLAESNENTVIVSSDAIREELTGKIEDQSRNNEVFEIFHQRIRKNLEEGKNAIADATNLLIKSRLRILNMTRRLDVEKICIICAKPFEICREHNMKREHPVPESVLDKQIRKFQIPFYEEGWDDIQIQNKYHLYRSDQTNKLLLAMMGFDQKNPHHDKDLGDHAVEVMARFGDCGYSESYNLAALFHDVGKLYTQLCKTTALLSGRSKMFCFTSGFGRTNTIQTYATVILKLNVARTNVAERWREITSRSISDSRSALYMETSSDQMARKNRCRKM